MSPVLDHVFVRLGPECVEPLERAGFDLGFRRDHPGQGTCNACALFPDDFLELLFVRDPAEAGRNLLRLHARSPFGIALRGTPPPGGPAWEVYDPPYGGGAFCFDVHPRSLQDPSVPLVFAMRPPGPPPRLRPGLEPARLRHPNGALGLGWLRFEGGPPPPITAPWLAHGPGPGRVVVGVRGAALPAAVDLGLLVVTAA